MLFVRFGSALLFGLFCAGFRFFFDYDQAVVLFDRGVTVIEIVKESYVYVFPHLNHLPCLHMYLHSNISGPVL